MGTSREGLLNSNKDKITSSPNQDYFWVLFWGLVAVLLFIFFYIFSPGAKRLRIHCPVQQNALHRLPLLGHLFKVLESD